MNDDTSDDIFYWSSLQGSESYIPKGRERLRENTLLWKHFQVCSPETTFRDDSLCFVSQDVGMNLVCLSELPCHLAKRRERQKYTQREKERQTVRQRDREIEWDRDRVDWERKEVVYHKANEIQWQHTQCQTSSAHKRQHRQRSLSNIMGQGKNLCFSSRDLQLNSCPLPRVHWRMLMILTEPSADPDLVDRVQHPVHVWCIGQFGGRSRRIPGSDSCSQPDTVPITKVSLNDGSWLVPLPRSEASLPVSLWKPLVHWVWKGGTVAEKQGSKESSHCPRLSLF